MVLIDGLWQPVSTRLCSSLALGKRQSLPGLCGVGAGACAAALTFTALLPHQRSFAIGNGAVAVVGVAAIRGNALVARRAGLRVRKAAQREI